MNLRFVIKLTFLLRLPAKGDTSCCAVVASRHGCALGSCYGYNEVDNHLTPPLFTNLEAVGPGEQS